MMSKFFIGVIFLLGVSQGLAESSLFGFATTSVTTSIDKKIKKNLGKLWITLTSTCQQSEDNAMLKLAEVESYVTETLTEAANHKGIQSLTVNDKLSKDPEPLRNKLFTLKYPDPEAPVDMAFFNGCTQETIGLVKDTPQDDRLKMLNDTVFGASKVIVFQAKDKISELANIKQDLHKLFTKYSEDNSDSSVALGELKFSIDEETQKKVDEELLSQLNLDSQITQINVDEEFHKEFAKNNGFKRTFVKPEQYANRSFNSSAQRYLQDDGTVLLKKRFYFTVQYQPTNLKNPDEETSFVDSESFDFDIEETLNESNVEAYVSVISVGASCQPSSDEALAVVGDDYVRAKNEIEKSFAAVSSAKNNIFVDKLYSPIEEFRLEAVGHKLTSGPSGANYEPSHWMDLCTGDLHDDKEEAKTHWRVTQSFKVHTSSYEAFKKVDQLAKDLNESIRLPSMDKAELLRLPIIKPIDPNVILKTEDLREAVDVKMYKKALMALTDPDGKVAEFLQDPYVLAKKARYSAGSFVEASQLDDQFSRSQGAASNGLTESVGAGKSYQPGNPINVDESNLEPHTVEANVGYTIVWESDADLLDLIAGRKEALEKAKGSEGDLK